MLNSYKNRPLSPHLTIYVAQWTSVLSILHRISGVFLVFVFFFSLYLLKFLSLFGSFYVVYRTIFIIVNLPLWLNKSIFFLVLLSLFYHFCNGIRHLIWDLGYALSINGVERTGKLVFYFSLLLCFIQLFRWFSY